MNKIFLSSVVALSLLAPVAASAAAPVVTRDTRWFDAQVVDGGKLLDVTGRVIAGTIDRDVAVHQMQTIDGKKVPNYTAFDSNMDAVGHHCVLSRRADEYTSQECNYKPGVHHLYPTITE